MKRISIKDALKRIKKNGPSYMGPREYFNAHGAWMGSADSGYDFFCDADNGCGYIYYWSDIEEDDEHMYKVPMRTYLELYNDFVYGNGLSAMQDYEEWEYKDCLEIFSNNVE